MITVNNEFNISTDVGLRFRDNLKSRRRKGLVFFYFCLFGTLFGIAMLIVLLSDIADDSAKWLSKRSTDGPRMFVYLYNSDLQYKARIDRDFPEIAEGMAKKVETKEKRLAKNEVKVTDAMRDEWRMDYLHSKYMADTTFFDLLEMKPTFEQSVTVALSVLHSFITSFPSRFFTKAGVYAALCGSLYLLVFTALFSVPIGIAAAVYLEEYAAKNRINQTIEVNIANLAGVPSIVYGILGLALFVRGIGWGHSVIAGAATMSLLIMPVIIIAAREAIKAVPGSIRWGAYALGATRWQVIRHHTLPIAMPGILTGVILAMSRAIGETAPMIMVGALSFVAYLPKGPFDDFTVLPIQIYNWASMPQAEFQELAAVGILVLLIVLLLMNSIAIIIRHKMQRRAV
jgi:phosphate transport system permease protein